jgi:hypothetical protein
VTSAPQVLGSGVPLGSVSGAGCAACTGQEAAGLLWSDEELQAIIERMVRRELAEAEKRIVEGVTRYVRSMAVDRGGVALARMAQEMVGLREQGVKLAGSVEKFGQALDTVARDKYELREENEQLVAERDELEGQQAEKFFGFAAEVSKDDFWDFALIMALGNRRKAATALQVAERSFYERVGNWSRNRNKGYQKMVRLMEWRKAVARRSEERLPSGDNDEAANPKLVKDLLEVMKAGDNLDYPALVKVIFVALRSQNRENWATVRGGLMEMIEGDVVE